jgi:glutamine amidotransferase
MLDMNKYPIIGIIDYGLGNLYSVQKACSHVGIETMLISSKDKLDNVDGVILPGVGAFGDAIKRLREKDLLESIIEKAKAGLPLLGICLGMQLLMDYSEEFGYHEGLGLIAGKVVKFTGEVKENQKIPQIQWNNVEISSSNNYLFSGISNGTFFYFLHSYYVVPVHTEVVAGTTEYRQIEYCSAIQKDNIFGAQFHPEKSGPQGLNLFQNFKNYVKSGKQ